MKLIKMEGRSKNGRTQGVINPRLQNNKVCRTVRYMSDIVGGTEDVQSLPSISGEQYIIKNWNSDS